jgi:hypothetical protein
MKTRLLILAATLGLVLANSPTFQQDAPVAATPRGTASGDVHDTLPAAAPLAWPIHLDTMWSDAPPPPPPLTASEQLRPTELLPGDVPLSHAPPPRQTAHAGMTVPEPTTFILGATALLGTAWYRRGVRRRQARALRDCL